MTADRLSPDEAARFMGVRVGFIRKGLQENRFPFGWAVQTGKDGTWTYWIGRKRFFETTGLKEEDEEDE